MQLEPLPNVQLQARSTRCGGRKGLGRTAAGPGLMDARTLLHGRDRLREGLHFGEFFRSRRGSSTGQECPGNLVRGKIVIAETRPEFVIPDRIASFRDIIDDGSHDPPLYIAIGLETSDDRVREKCINKGFIWEDFLLASKTARSEGAGIKAYLLVKPPFLTERESIDDTISSVKALRG